MASGLNEDSANRAAAISALRLRQSDYNVVIPVRGGRLLVHNGFTDAMAILEPGEVEALGNVIAGRDADPSAVRDLAYAGFVVRKDFDELAALRADYDQRRSGSGAVSLTVAPTLQCNFGCDYCFQGCSKPTGTMSSSVQDALVGMVSDQIPGARSLSIAWYGGEPLLSVSVIEHLSDRFIEIARAANIPYSASIVSNCYHLSESVARSLVDRRVQICQVTIDGNKAHHDDRRTLLSGGPTFDRIISNIRSAVLEVGLRVVVRINVDSRNADSCVDLLDSFVTMGLAESRNFSVYFAPIEAITEGCHAIASHVMSKSEYGRLEARLLLEAMTRGLCAAPPPGRFRGLCGALRPRSFVVLPNGSVHKCWDTVNIAEQSVGTVFDWRQAMSSRASVRWAEWHPFENDKCRACRLLPECAGSCAHKHLNPEQTTGVTAETPCPPWKHNLRQRIALRAIGKGLLSAAEVDLSGLETDPCVFHMAGGE